MTAPRTGGGVYRTLATIPHHTLTWLQRVAPLLPLGWCLSSFRWYRRAIGGHWERFVLDEATGDAGYVPVPWKRVERCAVNGIGRACEDYPPPRPSARGV